jgi:hypothetical protein
VPTMTRTAIAMPIPIPIWLLATTDGADSIGPDGASLLPPPGTGAIM